MQPLWPIVLETARDQDGRGVREGDEELVFLHLAPGLREGRASRGGAEMEDDAGVLRRRGGLGKYPDLGAGDSPGVLGEEAGEDVARLGLVKSIDGFANSSRAFRVDDDETGRPGLYEGDRGGIGRDSTRPHQDTDSDEEEVVRLIPQRMFPHGALSLAARPAPHTPCRTKNREPGSLRKAHLDMPLDQPATTSFVHPRRR